MINKKIINIFGGKDEVIKKVKSDLRECLDKKKEKRLNNFLSELEGLK